MFHHGDGCCFAIHPNRSKVMVSEFHKCSSLAGIVESSLPRFVTYRQRDTARVDEQIAAAPARCHRTAPPVFSARYSRTFARTGRGRSGADSIRAMVLAESPDPLCLLLSTVQVVLREIPSASACSPSERNPAAAMASPISLIFKVCRPRPGDREVRLGGRALPFERRPGM